MPRLVLKDSDRMTVFSQFGQEGLLVRTLDTIGHTCRHCVEFGAKDGFRLSNTALLARDFGYSRTLFDTGPGNPAINLHSVMITPGNINSVFAAHGVPKEPDLLTVDIDGMDFWVWRGLTSFSPRAVLIEINANIPPETSIALRYSPTYRRARDVNYGASALAMSRLGREKGYSCVFHCVSDLLFVRSDCLDPEDRDPPLPFTAPVALNKGKIRPQDWVDVPENPCRTWGSSLP